MPWGLCSGLLFFLMSGLCCQWSLETIRLLNSSEEPPAQLVLKKPPLDFYNLADCQTMPGLSLVAKDIRLFAVSLHGIRYIHRYIRFGFSVFANQGVIEGLSTPWPSKCKRPVYFLLGPATVFNSPDFNVISCKLQSWERTGLATLPQRGRLHFLYKVKSGHSFSQHPAARGFAEGALPTSQAAQSEQGHGNCSYFVPSGQSHPNATLRPSYPVSEGD